MEASCKKSAKGVESTPSSSSCAIANLPSSILMVILCRLPIKTLAASKSVCKSWLHLIRDPHFSEVHQARAPTEVCFLPYFDGNTTKLHMGNFHFLTDFGPSHVKLDTSFELPIFSVRSNNYVNYQAKSGNLRFANSCNGLLCFTGSPAKFAVIWNPCTCEFITFPAPKTHKGLSICRDYGLGFSRKANKFKLLRLVGRKETGSYAEVSVAEICTIEKDCSWKTLGPRPSIAWLPYATFFQGTLHWICDEMSGISVGTFDFEDDQFGRIQLPFHATRGNSDCLGGQKLVVLAGCLSAIEGRNIWMMKEYGVQDSWTKVIFLQKSVGSCDSHYLPLAYMDNGEVLMTCTDRNTTVFFYNPVLKSVRCISDSPSFLRVIAYRPSLLLLKDSMLGYDVHVEPMCADLQHRKMSTTPDWWTPYEESPRLHGSEVPLTNDHQLSVAAVEEERETHVGATREDPLERIKTMDEVLEELRMEREHGQELEERLRTELAKVEEFKQQTQQLEERLQDEHAKVEQLKEQILQTTHAKVKQLKEQMQQIEQSLRKTD